MSINIRLAPKSTTFRIIKKCLFLTILLINNNQIFIAMNYEGYRAFYITVMFAACLVSIYRTLYYSKTFAWFAGYLVCNFLAEVWAHLPQRPGGPNHYIYAFNLIACTLFLSIYLFTLAESLLTRLLIWTAYLIIMIVFASQQMWRTETIFDAGTLSSYYIIVSIVLLAVIWNAIVSEKKSRPDCSMFLLATLATYHILGFLNVNFNFTNLALSLRNELYSVMVTLVLNITYYLCLAIAILKLRKAKEVYAG